MMAWLPPMSEFKCPHLRCLQGEPQPELALAQRRLRFFQVRDIHDRTDRSHGVPPIGRIAIVPPPLDRHPPDGSVGPQDPMHRCPFSFIGRLTTASTLAFTDARSRSSNTLDASALADLLRPRTPRIAQSSAGTRSVFAARSSRRSHTSYLELPNAERLIAFIWRPYCAGVCAGCIPHRSWVSATSSPGVVDRRDLDLADANGSIPPGFAISVVAPLVLLEPWRGRTPAFRRRLRLPPLAAGTDCSSSLKAARQRLSHRASCHTGRDADRPGKAWITQESPCPLFGLAILVGLPLASR